MEQSFEKLTAHDNLIDPSMDTDKLAIQRWNFPPSAKCTILGFGPALSLVLGRASSVRTHCVHRTPGSFGGRGKLVR